MTTVSKESNLEAYISTMKGKGHATIGRMSTQAVLEEARTKCTEGLVDGLGLLEAVSLSQALAQPLTASQVNQIQHTCMYASVIDYPASCNQGKANLAGAMELWTNRAFFQYTTVQSKQLFGSVAMSVQAQSATGRVNGLGQAMTAIDRFTAFMM